jgi:hypothetical protein
MPRHNALYRALLVSISVAALAACSSSPDGHQAKTSAPMPPITEMDAAMSAPPPQPLPLSESDTLTPVMAQTNGVPPANETVEERIARLEQSIVSMQNDYQKIMPAFASLNTTNARIQTLLSEIEKDTGKKIAAAEAPAPIALTPPVTTVTTQKTQAAPPPILKTTSVKVEETIPATGVLPAPGTVSKAGTPEQPIKTVTNTTTTVATDAAVPAPEATAPPLSAFKEQPSVEEARAEAARQTGKATPEIAAAEASAAEGAAGSVTGVRIGEHGAKTRLVFDLDGKTKPAFKYDLDNAEKLLLVAQIPPHRKLERQQRRGWRIDRGHSVEKGRKSSLNRIPEGRRQRSGPFGRRYRPPRLIKLYGA